MQDPEAFATFYRRHVRGVLAFFGARTGDPEIALDLAAETFARALEGYRGAPSAAWLYTIARNLLIDSYRRGRVEDNARRRLAMEPIVLTDAGLARVAELTAADWLAELPADQAEAVRARVLEERAYEEIARELRCSEQVVRQRVSRGLRALRKELRDG